MTKPSAIVIVGPTASGKSALAVRLARKFNGEIISADSRQVYRGLDVGTGKISAREMRGVPHHLLGVANPRYQFNVVAFQRRASSAIRDISARGKIPFLVGGTGFWIDAAAYDTRFPAVAPDPSLRTRLAGRQPAALLAILRRLDPDRAKTVELKNPRRIIRAIEIAHAIGRTPDLKKRRPYRLLWIGITLPPHVLWRRIRMRLSRRLSHGMIAEARRLRSEGLPWRRFYELGLEYRFLADYLRGTIRRREMRSGLERAIRQYARRQLAWFRRNRRIHWLRRPAEAERLMRRFIAGEMPPVRAATSARRSKSGRRSRAAGAALLVQPPPPLRRRF